MLIITNIRIIIIVIVMNSIIMNTINSRINVIMIIGIIKGHQEGREEQGVEAEGAEHRAGGGIQLHSGQDSEAAPLQCLPGCSAEAGLSLELILGV